MRGFSREELDLIAMIRACPGRDCSDGKADRDLTAHEEELIRGLVSRGMIVLNPCGTHYHPAVTGLVNYVEELQRLAGKPAN